MQGKSKVFGKKRRILSNEEKEQLIFDNVKQMMADGNYEQAYNYLSMIMAVFSGSAVNVPENEVPDFEDLKGYQITVMSWFLAGEIAWKSAYYQEALGYLNEVCLSFFHSKTSKTQNNKQGLKQDPMYSTAYYMKAKCHQGLKQVQDAEKQYENYLKLEAPSTDILYSLAKSKFNLQKFDESDKLLSEIISQYADNYNNQVNDATNKLKFSPSKSSKSGRKNLNESMDQFSKNNTNSKINYPEEDRKFLAKVHFLRGRARHMKKIDFAEELKQTSLYDEEFVLKMEKKALHGSYFLFFFVKKEIFTFLCLAEEERDFPRSFKALKNLILFKPKSKFYFYHLSKISLELGEIENALSFLSSAIECTEYESEALEKEHPEHSENVSELIRSVDEWLFLRRGELFLEIVKMGHKKKDEWLLLVEQCISNFNACIEKNAQNLTAIKNRASCFGLLHEEYKNPVPEGTNNLELSEQYLAKKMEDCEKWTTIYDNLNATHHQQELSEEGKRTRNEFFAETIKYYVSKAKDYQKSFSAVFRFLFFDSKQVFDMSVLQNCEIIEIGFWILVAKQYCATAKIGNEELEKMKAFITEREVVDPKKKPKKEKNPFKIEGILSLEEQLLLNKFKSISSELQIDPLAPLQQQQQALQQIANEIETQTRENAENAEKLKQLETKNEKKQFYESMNSIKLKFFE